MNPALIRFSSGTTGESKGVLLCNSTLLERGMAANQGLQITPADRIVWVLPMSHHFAVSILLYLWNGATIVIPPTHFASDILSSATENRSTGRPLTASAAKTAEGPGITETFTFWAIASGTSR